MYFAIAYDLWPHLTGRALTDLALIRAQLWLWFVGMIVTTFPWHWVGILGMPRRMAYFDYSSPALSGDAISVAVSAIGGFILLASGLSVLGHAHPRRSGGREVESEPYRFATAVHPPVAVPAALNGFTPLDRADDRAHDHQLRLSDRAARAQARRRGPRRLHWRAAMSQETPLSPRDPWVVRSVGAAAAIFVISVVLGFMVFPLVQRNARASSLWDAICSAAGVSRGPTAGRRSSPATRSRPPS